MGRSDAVIRRCWKEWVDNGRFRRHDDSGRPRATVDRKNRLFLNKLSQHLIHRYQPSDMSKTGKQLPKVEMPGENFWVRPGPIQGCLTTEKEPMKLLLSAGCKQLRNMTGENDLCRGFSNASF
ncbi:hypothetical protein TNCV_2910421 [Trichonephila clavipes]|nr:hypothetical protein TNCV_2910421 [Trichonephila clavipes]